LTSEGVLHSAQFVAAREEFFHAVGQAILPAAAFSGGALLWNML
jgi:hypothetical protein